MVTITKDEAERLVKEGFEATHSERMKLQRERLKKLVAYAREHSAYFRELYRDIPEDFSLNDLPHTEKSVLIEHYTDWVTDPAITLPDVQAYCEHGDTEEGLYLGRYTVLHTSGTTGTPLFMVRDDHRNKIQGQLLAQRLLKGIPPETMDHTRRRIAAVIYAEHGASSYEGLLRQKYSVPGYEDNIIAVSVLDSIEEIVKQLNEFQPKTMSGYGSVLALLAQEKEAGRLRIDVDVIFNSAEALSPENHARIEKAFGCTVKNNYCMTEGGEIAMTVDSAEMLLNEDWIIVEPVDEQRRPVTDPDQWSGGILVTDLSNFVQPIIRYYVNDRVKIHNISDDSIRLPAFEINGRVNKGFVIAGKTFSSAGIDSIAEFWDDIADYQFVQTADDELQLRFVWFKGHGSAKDYERHCAELKKYFSEHDCAGAKVTWSEEPPIKNQRGGKTPRYIDLRK